MKKAVFYSLIIVAVCAFILRLFLNYASATETTLLDNYVTNNSGKTYSGLKHSGTSFTISGGGTINKAYLRQCKYNNIDEFNLYAYIASTTGTAYEIIATSTNAVNSADMEYAASAAACVAAGFLATEVFAFENVTIEDGENYALLVRADRTLGNYGAYLLETPLDNEYDNYETCNPSTQACTVTWDSNSVWFALAYVESYDNAEVIELGEWDGEIYIGAEGANIPRVIDCFINQTDCQTWLKYTYEQIDDIAYLIPYVSDGDNDPDTAISSSTLTQKLIMKEYFDLPTQTSATTTRYCVYINDTSEDDEDQQLCFTTVYYTDENDLGLPEYNIASACDDVASSSGDFWDDFRYGIECGIRKVVYWSFTPQPESVQKIRETYEDAKDNFPVSVYTEYQATFEAIGEYEGSDMTIPVGEWWDKTSGPEPIAEVTLSSSTLMTYIDEDFYETYYFYAQIFIYLLGAFYVFFRISSLTRGEAYDN